MATIPTNSRLNETAINAVRNNLSARNKLQYELNKSSLTIYRWIKGNSPKLATGRALKIISSETGLPLNELLQSA